MSMALLSFAGAPSLYLPPARAADGPLTGYLLAPGTTGPASLTVAEALGTAGWFVVAGPVADSAVPAFVASAQIWFASTARKGALLSWFTKTATLDGWTFFADAARTALSRLTAIQFGNLAVQVPPGTTIGADGDDLVLTPGANPVQFTALPYGARNPVAFVCDGPLAIDLAGAPDMVGRLGFGFAADNGGLDWLDFGLRCYAAPAGTAGYALTTRYRPFDFAGKVSLEARIDPLAPADPARSEFALAGTSGAASHYLSASGASLAAEFGADFRMVILERLVEVDAAGRNAGRRDPVYTLVPAGTVTLTNPAASCAGDSSLATTVMGGLSAVEYLAPAGAGANLSFTPGKPAFAPILPSRPGKDAAGAPRNFGTLSDAGRTSWVTIEPGNSGATYFSQPDQSVMYQSDKAGGDFLRFLPLAAASLGGSSSAAVPLMPYAAIAPGGQLAAGDLAAFERQVWSPARVGALRPGSNSAVIRPAFAAPPDPPFGTTPQGLLLEFGSDNGWKELTLALNSPALKGASPPSGQAGLILRNASATLQGALQTNQLFLVASAGDVLLNHAGIAYYLSKERAGLVAAQYGDPAVRDWLDGLVTAGPFSCSDKEEFKTKVIEPAGAPQALKDDPDPAIRLCADFSLFAAGEGPDPGWEFCLSPYEWDQHQTILIFKYNCSSLADSAADISQWSGVDPFCPDAEVVSQRIAAVIAKARSDQPTNPDLDHFVATVDDPGWTGIIALNAVVPVTGLPEQMRALAAGIDPARFQAHHVGVSSTPVAAGASTFTPSPSSVFALIDYENGAALAGSDDYAFKVQSLKVLIANSQVANFSSRADLLINRLFGEPASAVGGGNVLEFNGFYQQAQAAAHPAPPAKQLGSYQFVAARPTAYQLMSCVVDQVAVTGATFVTLPGTDDQDPAVKSVFMLNGSISFLPQKGFDLFSFGPEVRGSGIEQGLSYRSLAIRMSFAESAPNYRTITFDPSGLVVDPATSQARSASLVSHFPMNLTALVAGDSSTTPDGLGFMPVDSPLQGTRLTSGWYGLRFDLDLGSAGALAAKGGFTAGLLLGWAPSPDSAKIYVGLALPGVSGGQRSISLEGVVTLSFGGIAFVVAPPTYLLQLSNIAIKILSLTLPPGGQVNLTLFGNPQKQASGALGWLGAYLKNGAGQPAKPKPPQLAGPVA